MSIELQLEQIRIDGGTQSRCEINTDAVDEYADALQDGVVLPPVTVYFDGVERWLVDGFHRFHAHQKAGLGVIPCNVERGTKRAAILHSLGVNHDHGLRRTNADKWRAVETVLTDQEWGAWSNHEIGRICKVSAPFVAKVRERHTGNISSINTSERTFTHHKTGKPTVMQTAGIGAANASRSQEPSFQEVADELGMPVEDVQKLEAISASGNAELMQGVDSGRVTIDEAFEQLSSPSTEPDQAMTPKAVEVTPATVKAAVDEFEKRLNDVRKFLDVFAELPGGEAISAAVQKMRTDMTSVIKLAVGLIPTKKCSQCQPGKEREKCKDCGGFGMVGSDAWGFRNYIGKYNEKNNRRQKKLIAN